MLASETLGISLTPLHIPHALCPGKSPATACGISHALLRGGSPCNSAQHGAHTLAWSRLKFGAHCLHIVLALRLVFGCAACILHINVSEDRADGLALFRYTACEGGGGGGGYTACDTHTGEGPPMCPAPLGPSHISHDTFFTRNIGPRPVCTICCGISATGPSI